MNKVTQSIVKDKVMKGTKLYKHSFGIGTYANDKSLRIYVDIILQDNSPIVTDLSHGHAWQKVLPILQSLDKYLYKVKGHVTASDDSYSLDIYDFNELDFNNTTIMVKAVAVYTWGNDIGKTYFYDEDDFTPDEGEEVFQYTIYDINTGEQIYFIEI